MDDRREPLLAPPCDPPTAYKRRRIEIATTGIDDALQGRGANPYIGGGLSWPGLRVPAFVNAPATRYLFMLAAFTIAEGGKARIVGLRQAWTLGLRQANPIRVVELEVEDKFFKLPDGNISWHLRRMPLNYPRRPDNLGPIQPPLQNFAFKTSDTPALLYQTATVAAGGFYTGLTAYTPPNGGMPWGDALTPQLGTFNDLKVPWKASEAWHSLDVPVEGPCRVAFYASVLQSSVSGQTVRPALTAPAVNAFYANGLSAEEQFLLNFPLAIIWRVAGSLIVELEDYKP